MLGLLAAQGCSSSAKKKAPAPDLSKPVTSASLGGEYKKASKLDEAEKWNDALAAYEKFLFNTERFRREQPEAEQSETDKPEQGSGSTLLDDHEEIARERLGILHCIVERGGDYRFKTQSQLVSKLTDALREGDEKQLTKFASCDFVIGEPNTDNAEKITPENAGAVLSQAKKVFLTAEAPVASGVGSLDYLSPGATVPFGPIFEKEDSGWRWSGFVFNNWKQFQFVRAHRSSKRKHGK